jgi:hypothetical protein
MGKGRAVGSLVVGGFAVSAPLTDLESDGARAIQKIPLKQVRKKRSMQWRGVHVETGSDASVAVLRNNATKSDPSGLTATPHPKR